MDMQTIVDDWKANAERNLDRNFNFIHRLKMAMSKLKCNEVENWYR